MSGESLYHVTRAVLNQYAGPQGGGMLVNQLLYGEAVRLSDAEGDMPQVMSRRDGYVGTVDRRALSAGLSASTHSVGVPSTLLLAEPKVKAATVAVLPMLAELRVLGEVAVFSETSGGWVFSAHLLPHDTARCLVMSELVALAKEFLGTPYLWGGKSCVGLDCSGLVQLLFRRFGVPLPRDSQQQQEMSGWRTVHEPQVGDLVFWPGHVGVMIDAGHLLHSHASAMRTEVEPLKQAADRIATMGNGKISAIRRWEG